MVASGFGTTSACAENTPLFFARQIPKRNYLRVRGEYPPAHRTPGTNLELPPRARRIPVVNVLTRLYKGTTSACAENTGFSLWIEHIAKNYLRVRGEYGFWGWGIFGYQELPPRARRIPAPKQRLCQLHGTTSACAENTEEQVAVVFLLLELPPRARRIRANKKSWESLSGTTSACAENTRRRRWKRNPLGNYLRVRGEYFKPSRLMWSEEELPPRARRIQSAWGGEGVSPGTTSACAENTRKRIGARRRTWNYLRVRGEYSHHAMLTYHTRELPPRARRIPAQLLREYRIRGTTSACAENT